MKKCPFCEAEIIDEAVFCVHCKAVLDDKDITPQNSNVKICPVCKNECMKQAVICVKCGNKFESVKTAKTQNGAKQAPIAILYALLTVIGLIFSLISFISNIEYATFLNVKGILFTIIISVLTIIGMLKSEKRKLVGIASLISVFSVITSWIIGLLSEGSDFIEALHFDDVAISILTIIADLLLAVMFLSGEKNADKIWFVPAGIIALTGAIAIIVGLFDGRYEYGYYTIYFDWAMFFVDIVSKLSLVISNLILGVIAKTDNKKSTTE